MPTSHFDPSFPNNPLVLDSKPTDGAPYRSTGAALGWSRHGTGLAEWMRTTIGDPMNRTSAAGAAVSDTRRARVLLAEDDSDMRELVASLLLQDWHEVTTVADGNEMISALALESVTRFPKDAFDLIVTDVRMPGLTGINAIARLRNVGYSTPVIAITAFPDQVVRDRARELDVLVLDKPFKIRDFRDAAHYFLGGIST